MADRKEVVGNVIEVVVTFEKKMAEQRVAILNEQLAIKQAELLRVEGEIRDLTAARDEWTSLVTRI